MSTYSAPLADSVWSGCETLAKETGAPVSRVFEAGLAALIQRYGGVLAEPNSASLRVLVGEGTAAADVSVATARQSALRVTIAATAAEVAPEAHLTLKLSTASRGTVSWRYRKDVFEEAAVARIHAHFARLLASAVTEPDRPVCEFDLIDAAERDLILNQWNQTTTDYPRNASIPEVFAAVASAHAERIAVSDAHQALTYRALDEASNRLCRALLNRGVEPGARVGIALERSNAMIVAMLAILKAGAAYVPLDVTYPAERIQFMIADTDLRAIVTDEARKGLLPEGGVAVLAVDRDRDQIAQENAGPVIHEVIPAGAPESLAYVMYTSGSTGTPKGAAVPHRAILRLVKNATYVDFGPGEVFAQVSNSSFDAITFEVWGALLNGGRLVIVPQDVLLSPDRFAAAIREQGLTAMFLTASLFNLIAAQRPDAFGTVHHLLVGGDAVDPTWARRVLETAPPRRMINGYGPTESTTFAVTHWIAHVPAHATHVPIGRPLSNSQAYVLDQNLQPVPVGALGELYLGGDGLAQGYWKRPELTAERFLTSPFDETGRARLYKTGDLARYRHDGVIECLGRNDGQVKIRGFRIECGEIEVFLRTHPSVTDCAIVPESDAQGTKHLAAYIATDAAAPPSPVEIRQFLRAKLPEFMLPSSIVTMRRLPLTPNGKVDRAQLRHVTPLPAAPTRIPTTAAAPGVQQAIAQIWKETLGLENVGIDDNFFDLGGDSLRLVMVEAALRSKFAARFSITDLFEHTTIRSMAAFISDGSRGPAVVTESQTRAQKQKAAFEKARRASLTESLR